MSFTKLNLQLSNVEIYVNVSLIEAVLKFETGSKVYMSGGAEQYWTVRESVEEVMQLINQSNNK